METAEEADGKEGTEGAGTNDPAPCADTRVNPVVLTSAALGTYPSIALTDTVEAERFGSVPELM